MEIVIGMLALQAGIISQPIFVAIVFGAIVSSFILGPWLNLAVKRRKIQSILPFLDPHHVTLLNAKTKRQALLELTRLVAGDSSIPAQRFYKLACNREQGMSSAVEFGIAFPHARVPDLTVPMIAVGISQTGIEWDSPDGLPSKVIVLIVTPETQEDAQLQILRLFSICLSNETIRQQLQEAGDNHQVYKILSACFSPGSLLLAG
ncbi:MAG: PTS sugar transporter subunit IIA [Candidatus Delongbacteria bacterium]|nr:PTS sugar transporter subunit IIA [Candidatus Delongbacteria bacterium]